MIDIVRYNTLQDENIPGNQFCDQAQNGQIHGSKYSRVLIFENHLYKLS